jgi:hypothetical protein
VNLSLRRLVVIDVVLGVLLFLLAWAFESYEDGVGAFFGAVGWFGMWLCVLGLLVLAGAWFFRFAKGPETA